MGSSLTSSSKLLLAVVTAEEILGLSISILFEEVAIPLLTVADPNGICRDSLASVLRAMFGVNEESFAEIPVSCKAARDSINSEKPAHGISTSGSLFKVFD